MMTRLKRLVRSAKCVVLSALAATALGSTALGDTVLEKDENWRGQEAEKLTGTIDLNGHKLTVSQLAGDCEITDSVTAYERLDCIKSAGKQYIDTKYQLLKDDAIDVKAVVNSTQVQTYPILFGSSPSSGNGNYFFRVTSTLRWKRGTVNTDATRPAGFVDDVIDVHAQGKTLTWTASKGASGTMVSTGTLANSGRNCYVMSENDADGKAKTQYCTAGSLYLFKITSGSTVVRELVPVRRVDNQKVGLLDLRHLGSTDAANPEFYENASGTGAFTAGTPTGEMIYTRSGSAAEAQPGELHVDVASGTTVNKSSASPAITGTLKLVKEGAGTFVWGGGTLAATIPVLITNGVFKMGVTTADVFGSGGTITVKENGQYDLNQNVATSPTINRTFYIEGDGPDRSGAIVNNNTAGTTGGQTLKTVYLTGDATIGGSRRIDFRGTAGTCRLFGEGYVLTIKNTGRVAFCAGDSGCKVDRIVVDGGFLQPCVDSTGTLDVEERIELRNGGKLISWGNSTTKTFTLDVPVTVGAGGGTIGTDAYNISITKPVTVEPGCTATVAGKDGSCWVKFADVAVGAGAMLNYTLGQTPIVGTLSGSGTVKGNAYFGSGATRWTMAADAEGWTSKADLSGASATALKDLAAIDITYAGTTSKELEIGPALGLTAGGTLPALTVKTPDGDEIAGTLAIKADGKLYVNIDLGAVVTATWTGAGEDGELDNPANWACMNALGGAVVEGLPSEATTVTFTGDKIPSIPTDSEFTARAVVLSGAALSADRDWRGLSASIPVSGKIDLNGRKLTVSQLAGDCEITDTSVRDYELLDYIVTDGTQSIKTGCTLESHTWIDMSFRFYDSNNYINNALFGSSSWGYGNYLFCTEKSGSNGILKFLGPSEKTSTKTASANTDTTVSIREGKVTVKVGTNSGTYTTDTSLSTSRTLVLFAKNGNSGTDTSRAKIWLYSMKVCAPGGTTVWRDFVPARRMSDGAIGLLDKANPGPNEFYAQTNGGNDFDPGTKTGDYHIGENPGELHVDVASGTTVNNTTVALTGSLKLVKEGAGTFMATKTGQTYSGGTEVAGGQFNVPSGSESASQCLGAADTPVAVGAGATLELNGNTAFNVHPLVLAGGTVQNSSATEAKLGDITLTADSLLKTPYTNQYGDFGIASGSTIDLGGFKLTVDFLQKKNKQLVIYGPGVQMANGTIRLQNSGTGWGCLWLKDGDIDAPTVSFEVADAQFNLDSTLSISNYTALSALTVPNHEGVALNVSGTFKPFGGYFYAATLQNGAVLDLSDQTAAWSTTCTGGMHAPTTVAFADNATITIDVGARELAKNDKVVEWTAKPANAAWLTFRIDGTNILPDEKADVRDDGIYYTADPDEIVAAVWTGTAGTCDSGDPANWECINAMGKVDTKGGLPGAKTDVTLAGALALDIPSTVNWKSLTANNVSLTNDCDWSGLAVPVSGKIELNGRKLTVADLPATWAAEITDSVTAYERLDCIKSAGKQYIDTKYQLLKDDAIDVTAVVNSTQVQTYPILFGSSPSSGNGNYFFRVSSTLRWKRGTVNKDATRPAGFVDDVIDVHAQGKTLTWTASKGASGTMESTGTLADCGRNCYVMSENDADGKAKSDYCTAGSLYSFKITKADGTVVRELVPVRRLDDQKVGLLDLRHLGSTGTANPEFYENASGTGAFTAGTPTGEMIYTRSGSAAEAQPGELHVDVASGTMISGSVKLSGGLKLVKEGEGTLKWNGGANSVAASCPVVVTNGVFGFDTDDDDVFGSGGTITIAGKGQMDISKKSANASNTSSPVYNRTLYIEGDGPDGSGAITRSVTGGGYGYHLKVVNLTGDATIGGKSRVDFRGTGYRLNGAGHTLTVKNTNMLCIEDSNNGPITAKRIVVTDGGKLEPCDGNGLASLQIAECIELTHGGKLMPWHRTASSAYSLGVPVTVGAGGGTIGTDQGKLSITKPVTVLSGATATVSQTVTFEDVEVQGTLNATGTADITGTLSGSGAITGTGIAFGGANSCWDIAFDVNGETSKVDFSSAPTGLTKITVLCGGTEAEKTYDLAPAGTLTAAQVAAITLAVTDATARLPLPGSQLAIADGRLVLTVVRDTRPLIAHWTGAAGDNDIANARNWACTNLYGEVKDSVPCEITDVYLKGGIGFNLTDNPNWQSLTANDAALSDDCDWSGLTLSVSGKIDLNGRKLTVSQLAGDCEITDSVTAYERLDYISGNASQYVDTKYILKANDVIDTRMYIPKNQNRTGMLLGCSSTGKNWYLSPNNGADYFRWKRGNTIVGSSTGSAFPKAYDTIVDIRTSGDTFTWENAAGDSGSLTATGADIVDCDRPCYILGENDAEGGQYCSAGRIYSFTITSGGTVVRELVPVRRSDGVVGLLDLEHRGSTDAANPEFYENASGTGAFTAGATTGEMIYTRSGSAVEAQPGELYVDVASGTTVENTTVTLSGGLKLVKEGAGTFTAAKQGQTYAGGTEIAAGKAVFAQSGDPSSPWSADRALFGAGGSTITVDADATLNVLGTRGLRFYDFVLAGGTLENSRLSTDQEYFFTANDDGFGNVTLTADSTLHPYSSFVFNRGVVELGGHTLTIDFGNWGGRSVFLVGAKSEEGGVEQQIKNGTLNVVNGKDDGTSVLKLAGSGRVQARGVTLHMVQAKLDMSGSNLYVGDYISEVADSKYFAGKAGLYVSGTFRPTTEYFYGCTLQNGSTLDLTAQDGVWNATSAITGNIRKTVTFADNATVTIVPQKSAGEIVNWEGAAPTNLNTLKFRLAPGYPGRPSASVLGIRIRTWLKVFFL